MNLDRTYRPLLEQVNGKIWSYAETKFGEYRSAKVMEDALRQAGYEVTSGVADIPTAFVATMGSGSPVIGLLAEYDALDGLSQQADAVTRKPRPETTHGHGCGHNLLGTGILGAALMLRDAFQDGRAHGTVRIYGCPGEEGGSGKTYMARAGLFDGLDIALTWHPSTMTASMTGSLLANIQSKFHFHGKSAHAGFAAHLGRSALDAVQLMNVGTNYLREHMDSTDRIHYAVTNTGGRSPNVVQQDAEVLYLIRSRTTQSAAALYQRVCDIAKGAALMTGTTVEITFDKACSQVYSSDVLGQLMYDIMCEWGVPQRTPQQQEYLRSMQQTVGEEAVMADTGMMLDLMPELRRELITQHPDGAFVFPYKQTDTIVTASSDMGDVSCIAPLTQLQIACFALGTDAHSWQWVAQGCSDVALDGVVYAAQVLTEAALRLMKDTQLIAKAQEELREAMGGHGYECPIPPEVSPSIQPRPKDFI